MFHKVRLVHAWAGLVLSVLLVILGLSGTLLVFKNDYLRATIPDARISVDYETHKIGAAIENIEAQFRDAGISYVSLAHDDMALHRIVFKDGSAAYADQSGAVLKTWERNGSLEDWIFHLHHYLFLGQTGKNIAGIAGFAALVMVITGLIIVVPFLHNFSWRVWPKSLKRRALLAQHRDLGVIFAVPIVVIAFTGASMVFSKPVNAFLSVVTASTPVPFERPTATSGNVDWVRALAGARAAFPDAQMRLVSWPRSENAPVSIRLRQPNEWHQNGRTYVYIDPASSDVLATRDANKLSRGERAFNILYPLHSIAVGGRLYDVVGALTGVVMSLLGGIGSWTFIAQMRRRRINKSVRVSVAA